MTHTYQEYTDKEVDAFLAGMRFSRKIAMDTDRGLIAGGAIQSNITRLTMLRDVAIKKGALSAPAQRPVKFRIVDQSYQEREPDSLAALRSSLRSWKMVACMLSVCGAAIFLAPHVNAALEREEQANQETRAYFYDPMDREAAAEYFPPEQ